MNRYIKLFFKRISKDFNQKELLPLKLLFFIHASTIVVLYPYLTIHMRELGINVEETAIMSAITPAVAILMPPLAGMIADKIGNFKVLLAFFSAAGGASALLFLIVPVGRVTLTYPNQIVLGVKCQSNSSLQILTSNKYPCDPKTTNPDETSLNLQTCGFICHSDNDKSYSWTVSNYSISDSVALDRPIMKYVVIPKEEIRDANENVYSAYKPLKIDLDLDRAVTEIGDKSYFFPAKDIVHFSCTFDHVVGGSQKSNSTFIMEDDNTFCLVEKQKLPNATIDINYTKSQFFNNTYSINYFKKNDTIYKWFCQKSNYSNAILDVEIWNNEHENSTEVKSNVEFRKCSPACVGLNPREQFCKNSKGLVDLNIKVTFWSYLAVRVFIGIIGGTAFSMFEGAVIAILREHKADYGLQRIYAAVGGMISSPLAGWLIDYNSRGKEYTDFRPIFFIYASLKVMSAVLILFINLEFKTPANNVMADVFTVLKDIELITLLIVSFVLGTAWGFIESFLFWLLQDLGGSKSLMGITITIGGIAGIPLLVLSGPIIKRIGHANVLLIGFIFYAIRLFGYSLIYNPWLCLIFEAMESITSSLSFTAAVTYAAQLSTVTTDTSIQGMLGGIYYGVGKGSGSLIGGYSIKIFGTRPTYRMFAAATLFTGVIYFLFNYFYISKRKKQGNGIKDENEKDGERNEKKSKEASIENVVTEPTNTNIITDESSPYVESLTNYAYEPDEDEEKTTELSKEQIQKA